MARSLVVGANGFLGRHVAASLVDLGDEVDGVVHHRVDQVPRGVRVVGYGDLESLPATYDRVFDLAASIPYGRLDEPSGPMLDANVALVVQLHRRFPDARLVLASSVAVYGHAPLTRTEALVTESPTLYGLSKLAGETIARFHATFSIVRFSSLCGVGMTAATFLPTLVRQAKTAGVLTLFGDGSRRQDYLHVADAAALTVAAASAPSSGVYLGVNGESFSNRAIAERLSALVPGTRIDYVGEDRSPSFDYDARVTRAALGVSPRRTVFDAAEELLAHEPS